MRTMIQKLKFNFKFKSLNCFEVRLKLSSAKFKFDIETFFYLTMQISGFYLLPRLEKLLGFPDENVRSTTTQSVQAWRSARFLDAGDWWFHAVNDGSLSQPTTLAILQIGRHAPLHSSRRSAARTIVGAHETGDFGRRKHSY